MVEQKPRIMDNAVMVALFESSSALPDQFDCLQQLCFFFPMVGEEIGCLCVHDPTATVFVNKND